MNVMKLIQTVNYVLSKFDGKLNYTKLIKLLYLADREAILQTDFSITGDTYASMPLGPVLENTYDFIRGISQSTRNQSLWNTFFLKDSFILKSLQNYVPISKLSKFETDILDTIVEKYRLYSYEDMVAVVHNKDICPEWTDPKGSSLPLPKQDILLCMGRTKEQIEAIEEEDRLNAADDNAFID